MAKAKGLKRTQIQGKQYDLPPEEIDIQKLILKGSTIDKKIRSLKQDLETIKSQLIKIATKRRDGSTTVKLEVVTGSSTVTFRESYTCDNSIEEINQELGSLFERFFTKKTEFKTTKELKQFLDGDHAYGIESPETLKELILTHVDKKTIKPNVKIEVED